MWRLLLGTMGVKSLVQGLNTAATAGFEPRTVWFEVRLRNRLATASWFVLFDLQIFWGGVYPPSATTWEICRSKSTNQFGERNERLPDLCFSICRFSQVVFIPQAQPHAQSFFLFPIVFGINLIHFFDFFDQKEERCSRKFDRVLCCFDPLSITPFDSAKNTICFKKCNVFGNGKCELSAFQKVRNWGAKFWQGKAQNSSPILRCTFLARRSAKLIANFSATMVTSLPSVSLSLSLSLSVSLSLSLSLSHRMYLTHNIGSASALPIIKQNEQTKKNRPAHPSHKRRSCASARSPTADRPVLPPFVL